MTMIPRKDVAALAAALRDVLSLPLPAGTVEDRAAFQGEREIRIAHVRAWCDTFITVPYLPLAEITSALAGMSESRSMLPYLPLAEQAYMQGRLAEQRHQLFDPTIPALTLVPAIGGAV